MSAKKKDVAECLEVLFGRLDEAKLSPETMLKSEDQRERYESILMFAFRKLQAARYHRQRVDELIEIQRKEMVRLQATSEPKGEKLKHASATMRVSKSANEFAFELCAFFAAVRSAVDFLVIACAQHIKEAQDATSITTFLKLIKNGKQGPILKIIAEDAEWLIWLRDYRDYVVHRLVVQTTSGGEVRWKSGKAVTISYPVVVPSETPINVPDTRRTRAFDEPESRFTVSISEASVIDANGKQRLIKHSVEIEPAIGYIRVEDLMKRESAAFEHFFVRIVEVLIKLNFAPMPPAKKSP